MRIFILLILSLCTAGAAPMLHRELDLHVRMGTPEAQIIAEVQSRKLIAPLDPDTEAALVQKGAKPSLIAKLKSPGMALAPQQTQAEVQRLQAVNARARAEISEAHDMSAKRNARNAAISRDMLKAGTVSRWLEGKLVRSSGGTFKSVHPGELKQVKLYAIYASASWCGPCRQFTPKLVKAYGELKARYPEFEVIFYSADKTKEAFEQYVNSYEMPWPCVLFGKQAPELEPFLGSGIPWLVGISDTGVAITKNGVEKEAYISPEEILAALAQTLEAAFGKR